MAIRPVDTDILHPGLLALGAIHAGFSARGALLHDIHGFKSLVTRLVEAPSDALAVGEREDGPVAVQGQPMLIAPAQELLRDYIRPRVDVLVALHRVLIPCAHQLRSHVLLAPKPGKTPVSSPQSGAYIRRSPRISRGSSTRLRAPLEPSPRSPATSPAQYPAR